jgi:hypothetical protein
MYTGEGFLAIFDSAGLPQPTVIDLLSGATLFTVERAA